MACFCRKNPVMAEFTHRERVLLTLEHQEPDFVPFDCTFTVAPYQALVKYLGLPPEPLNPNMWLEVRPSLAVVETLGLDTCYLDAGSPKGTPEFTFGMDQYTDVWGLNFRKIMQSDGNFYYELHTPPLANATIDDLDDYPWPDPKDDGWTEGLTERASLLRKRTDRAIFLELPVGIFEHAYLLRGMQKFLIDLVANPDFAVALMDRLCDIAVGVARTVLGSVGQYIDVLKHLDDTGSQHAPMISPQMFQQMVCPRFKRLFQTVKEEFSHCNPRGKIMTHTDGVVYPLIEDYINVGIDVLNPVQPNLEGMDHKRIKREFGDRLAFHGGVDIQHTMPFGTTEEVAAEVHQRINDLAPGGGYILAPAHNLQHDVPPANVIALRDATREFGRYPLKN